MTRSGLDLTSASVEGMGRWLTGLENYNIRRNHLLSECRRQLGCLPESTSLIHVVSGLNGMGHRNLSYPQQLEITSDMLRAVEDSRVETSTLISFDFPWAERLAGAVGGIHPLQIADSLLRQGLPISFLGLDINFDYWPGGSAVRDPFQWIDLIDVWAQLGLPLILCMRVPTESGDLSATVDRRTNQTRSDLSDQNRIDFLNTVLPMIVARPSIHGLIWRQWQDSDDTRFLGGGFVDAQGNEKEINISLDKMRRAIRG